MLHSLSSMLPQKFAYFIALTDGILMLSFMPTDKCWQQLVHADEYATDSLNVCIQ